MRNQKIELLRSTDVHVLAVWTNSDTGNTSYVVSPIHCVHTGHPNVGEDIVVIYDELVANLHANTAEELFPIVEKTFPHLRSVGTPINIEDQEVLDTWHFYADDIGIKNLLDDAASYGYRLPYPDNVHPIK